MENWDLSLRKNRLDQLEPFRVGVVGQLATGKFQDIEDVIIFIDEFAVEEP